MKVPQLDLLPQYEALRTEIEPKILSLCARQAFVLGPEVEGFENEMAEYGRVSHAVGCASGTDALTLALMALDIGPGDEVVTTAFTFVASAEAIVLRGATPVFADIDAGTFNVSEASVANVITPKTRAIVPVDLFGQCANISALAELAARYDIPIIEDAAQSVGAEHQKRRPGELVPMATLSFYPSKNLGAFGDGGMVLTNSQELATRLKRLRVHGESSRYVHDSIGTNSRLDALQACVLRVKLKYLDIWIAKRQEIARKYNEGLASLAAKGDVTLPLTAVESTRHVFNQYTIRAIRRDELRLHLQEKGIGTAVYYPIPQHRQKAFVTSARNVELPETDRAANEVLSLPMFPELRDDQLELVVDELIRFYGRWS